jgi:hypothetical protein
MCEDEGERVATEDGLYTAVNCRLHGLMIAFLLFDALRNVSSASQLLHNIYLRIFTDLHWRCLDCTALVCNASWKTQLLTEPVGVASRKTAIARWASMEATPIDRLPSNGSSELPTYVMHPL